MNDVNVLKIHLMSQLNGAPSGQLWKNQNIKIKMILMYYNPLNKIKMHEVKEKEREKKKKEEEKKKGRGEERRALLKNKATIKY